MTVVVAFNGTLAADSQTTMQGKHGRNSIKVNSVCGVTFNKSQQVVGYACCGSVLDIAEFDNLIKDRFLNDSQAKFELEEILQQYASPLINKNLQVLFLMSDGSVLKVDLNNVNMSALKLKPKSELVVIGSGASICSNVPKDIKVKLTAMEYAYVASKLAPGCGGPINYINITNTEVSYFKPNINQKDKIRQWIDTVLFN